MRQPFSFLNAFNSEGSTKLPNKNNVLQTFGNIVYGIKGEADVRKPITRSTVKFLTLLNIGKKCIINS